MTHIDASDELFEQGLEFVLLTMGPGSRCYTSTSDVVRAVDPDANRPALPGATTLRLKSFYRGTIREEIREAYPGS